MLHNLSVRKVLSHYYGLYRLQNQYHPASFNRVKIVAYVLYFSGSILVRNSIIKFCHHKLFVKYKFLTKLFFAQHHFLIILAVFCYGHMT